MSNITYNDKSQSAPYDSTKWNAQDANEIKTAVNSKVDAVTGKVLSTNDYTTTEKTKLAGVATAATANDTDANLKNRANHTGTQAISTVTNLQSALDAKASKVSGTVPLSELPIAYFSNLSGTGTQNDPYIFTGGSSSVTVDQALVDGSINPVSGNAVFDAITSTKAGLSGGYTGTMQDLYNLIASGNITPAAPTNGVVDDSANTFTFNRNPNIPIEEHEYSVNTGSSWINCTTNVINIGDISLVVGQLRVRTKAASGRNPSAALTNSVAFTASGGTPTPGGDPLITYRSKTLVTTTDNDQTYTGSGSPNFGFTVSQDKIPAGSPFVIQISASAMSTGGGGMLGVGLGTNDSTNGGMNAGIRWTRSSNTVGRFYGTYINTNGNATGIDDFSSVTFTGTPLGRIRGTGTSLFVEYSFDAGITWTSIDNTINAPQPNADMYIKTFYDTAASTVLDILTTGVVTA